MIINSLKVIKKYGIIGTFIRAGILISNEMLVRYYKIKHRHVEQYRNPSQNEFLMIERELYNERITINEMQIDVSDFELFKSQMPFPVDYHGGINSGVWDEKIIEHYITYKILSLEDFDGDDVYIDVAAGSSPWAQILRDKMEVQSYAIDRDFPEMYKHLGYYRSENATKTTFPDSSVRGISLHCAFEMFEGDDDIDLLKEINRIMQPGGKCVIVPLYMYTHYCSYSSPEYWGKGHSDKDAKEYISLNSKSIPFSRKYDVAKLKERILRNIVGHGMTYNLHVLRNKENISPEVYCHFILEIIK